MEQKNVLVVKDVFDNPGTKEGFTSVAGLVPKNMVLPFIMEDAGTCCIGDVIKVETQGVLANYVGVDGTIRFACDNYECAGTLDFDTFVVFQPDKYCTLVYSLLPMNEPDKNGIAYAAENVLAEHELEKYYSCRTDSDAENDEGVDEDADVTRDVQSRDQLIQFLVNDLNHIIQQAVDEATDDDNEEDDDDYDDYEDFQPDSEHCRKCEWFAFCAESEGYKIEEK